MVIISEEAEALFPLLRHKNPAPPTHLVVYSAPVTKTMLPFNKLRFYSYPSLEAGQAPPVSLIADIGIVSGRLYFEFSEIEFLSRYLRGNKAGHDDTEEAHEGTEAVVRLGNKALDFVAEWLVHCRRGQDILQTPMGYLCQGRPLTAKHPFFEDTTAGGAVRARSRFEGSSSDANREAEWADDSGSEDEQWVTVEDEGRAPEKAAERVEDVDDDIE